jgi:mannose-6-phosphate isomerase
MDSERLEPFRLTQWFSERPWGRLDLRPWFGSTGTTKPVGEAWLTGPECVVETGTRKGQTLSAVAAEVSDQLLGAERIAEFPLLVKLLFPAEKLSVQVHPDDAQAQMMGQPRGKTECWYVLEAKPGATIALGLCNGVTDEIVRAAVVDGTLEQLMQWVPVSAGEMIFVDAGTVHAIGPGVVLLETQQTCDVTFRLYDYGRPRELHVEEALRVMRTSTAAGKVRPIAMEGFTRLIDQKYFVVDRYEIGVQGSAVIPIAEAGCVVCLNGKAILEAEGLPSVEMPRGQAVVIPARLPSVAIRSSEGASFVRCFAPIE